MSASSPSDDKRPSRPPLGSGGALKSSDTAVGGKRLFPKSSARKPLTKEQKPMVTIIGGIFIVIFISIVWYFGMVLPAKQAALAAQQESIKKEQENARLRQQIQQTEQQVQQSKAVGLVTVATNPAGATVTLGGVTQVTTGSGLITFNDVALGSRDIKITLPGYEDVSQVFEVKEKQITALGIVKLVRSTGKIEILSPYDAVTYSVVIEPESEAKSGPVPAALTGVPTGNYVVTGHRADYETVRKVTVKPNETTKVNLDFPYGSVQVSSEPSGAKVFEGKKELGVTPLTLNLLKPGAVKYRVVLRGYKVAMLSGQVAANNKLALSAKLEASQELIGATGLEMVWLPAGYWAGKYEVTQEQYQAVTGYNPSAFSGLQKPVESVSWNDAMEFCKQLNAKEKAAGKLPAGYSYTLPTETEWLMLAGDATLDDSVTSKDYSRNSTEDVGSMSPNQWGVYDARGNVWEWCRNPMDAEGKLYPTRGACWLSSKEEDLKISGRSPAPVNYKDKFVGFRVVLAKP